MGEESKIQSNEELLQELKQEIGDSQTGAACAANVKMEDKVKDDESGNCGWKCIASMVQDTYDVLQFEKYFCNWHREAILLIEITHAKDYVYVTPMGIFTHIGTLARALQHIFEHDWDIHAMLLGDELSFNVNKHIKDTHYSYVCHLVELNQAYSRRHNEGWKFNSTAESFHIIKDEAMSVINSLSSLVLDPELEASVHFGTGEQAVRVKRVGNDYILTKVSTPPSKQKVCEANEE